MRCHIIAAAFHCLCSSETHTWSEIFLKFQTKINISENSRELNQWSQTCGPTSSTSVCTDTAWELMGCRNLISPFLKYFPTHWCQFPVLARCHRRTLGVLASETRKGEGGEGPEGEEPQRLCLTDVLTFRDQICCPLGFRALEKAYYVSPQSKKLAKGMETF